MTHIFPIVELSGLKNKKNSDEKQKFSQSCPSKFCRFFWASTTGNFAGVEMGGGLGGSNYFVLQTAAKILRFKY